MKSLIPLKDKTSGFTLIEIMVVIAMLIIITSFGLYFDFDNFRSYSFHSERDILISSLQHARSRAVSNICYGATCTDGKPHGVYIESDKFIIFQGSSYATRDAGFDTPIETNKNITHTGMPEFVFDQLTGDGTPGDVTLTDPANGRTSTITINSEGQILWTN